MCWNTQRFYQGYQLSMSDLKKATSASKQAAGCLFTNFEDVRLTDEERVYLNAAATGDIGIIRMSLEESEDNKDFNVNCVDFMGRNALHLAVDSENTEVMEMLLDKLNFECIEEALLHAISKAHPKLVRLIIEHPNYQAGEDQIKRMDSKNAFFRTTEKSQFSPDITPLILSAHYNNHEMVQMFLSRNHTIDKPHPISCQCNDCQVRQDYDSLKRSRSRLNAYRALASPSYMALSSPDPIMTTFELRQEMMKLAEIEKEFKKEYLTLVEQCMNFACEMMDLCRGTQEVEAVISDFLEDGTNIRDPLGRLRLAIQFEEKKFVAHPNCQQYLTTIWYGSETAFLQSWSLIRKIGLSIAATPLLPLLCLIYIMFPTSNLARSMRCPAAKFATHVVSHFSFLILLAAATFRLEENYDEMMDQEMAGIGDANSVREWVAKSFRPSKSIITHVQIYIVLWVAGLLLADVKHIYFAGFRSYIANSYNILNFCILSMYIGSYTLRIIVDRWVRESDLYFNATMQINYLLKNNDSQLVHKLVRNWTKSGPFDKSYFITASRFQWKYDDPEIVSDVLFAVANVVSFARTTYLMPAFEALGPLQISFTRMLTDITRFMVLYLLVLLAFMVGLHNLYWYYGLHTVKKNDTCGNTTKNVPATELFEGLSQTLKSLFWSMFSQISITNLPIKKPDVLPGDGGVPHTVDDIDKADSTKIVDGVGMLLFAVYHGIIIIVLVNMLIAMMSHSFESIQEDCDVEWKFARTQLWLNYIDNGSTLPVPFNVLPTPHSLTNALRFIRNFFNDDSRFFNGNTRSTAFVKVRRDKVVKEKDLVVQETSHSDIMQRLVRRYLFKMERENDADENMMKSSAETSMAMYGDMQQAVQYADADDSLPTQAVRSYISPDQHSSPSSNAGLPGGQQAKRSKKLTYGASRRYSSSTGQPGLPPGMMSNLNLQLPQLDSIQRTQKILDMRLQNLQAQSDQLNCASGNARIKEEIMHVRQLIGENQKALSSIVKAVSQMQDQV
ncbi:short transient receptor potential channel 3, partial [Clonorchis sinensis]